MRIHNVIKGLRSTTKHVIRIKNPLSNDLMYEVPRSQKSNVDEAVLSCKQAFPSWSKTSVSHRARLMMDLGRIVREEMNTLSYILASEHGKNIDDAKGDIYRGLEVIDFATNATTVQMGETLPNVSKGIDTYSYKVPLGVCAGIAPYNFPAMIPLWMFPLALVTGNTFVLKPSEYVPATTMELYRHVERAGFPPGVLNIVHGAHEAVDSLCEHPDVKSVSFVGSDTAGRHVYRKASHHGKRVQCNMGAQNYAVLMPDASDDAVKSIVSAAFGSAGQRCMAISRLIIVDDEAKRDWVDELLTQTKRLSVGSGLRNADVPPVISSEARARIETQIEGAVQQGADCILDGRNVHIPDFPHGNFVAPTILNHVSPEMDIHNTEVFGPVLQIIHCKNIYEAIETINSNAYGNGTAIFTQNGIHARLFQEEVTVGQVGINIPLPVPLPMFSFTGWKDSFWGSNNFYGKSAIHFFTQTKTVTAKWIDANESHISTAMPIM
jgi:malonate-semialdehyde dehydrogenase (acetylating)/methylmalonate-semialdehyde dehydrogenase